MIFVCVMEEMLIGFLERITTIKIISIDDDKRSFNIFSCTPNGMSCSPGFCSALNIICRSFFDGLYDEVDLNLVFVFFNNHLFKITMNSFTYNADNFFATKRYHILNGKFEEDFIMWSNRINLFEPTISASETGSHDN